MYICCRFNIYIYTENRTIYIYYHFKKKRHLLIMLGKFVIYLPVDKETNGSYSIANGTNGLSRLNKLAYL
jgi:hypothetical protein